MQNKTKKLSFKFVLHKLLKLHALLNFVYQFEKFNLMKVSYRYAVIYLQVALLWDYS